MLGEIFYKRNLQIRLNLWGLCAPDELIKPPNCEGALSVQSLSKPNYIHAYKFYWQYR